MTKINATNTGKNVTITVRDEVLMAAIRENALRGKLSYNAKTRRVTLRPHAIEGWKFCDKGNGALYLSVQSRVLPTWPAHGKVELEIHADHADWVAVLPEKAALPPATPRTESSHKAKEVVHRGTDPVFVNLPASPPNNGNVILEVKGKTWCFQVPDDELLELAVGLAAQGYATK
jgi:hypothetical protein